jgi:peptidoglycan/LPS O-acetylase OafA/YrhL
VKNSFNILRLALALVVVIDHAGPATGAYDWVHLGKLDVGSLALFAFFTISGFLITPGLMNGDIWGFLRRRAGRIMPGWWVVVLITAFGFATIWQLQAGRFLLQPLDLLKYLALNSILVPGSASEPSSTWNMLNGLPLNVPAAGQVNVALWSLPLEFGAYLILAVIALFAFKLLRNRFSFKTITALALAATSALSITVAWFAWNIYAANESAEVRLLQKWPYLLAFMAGVFLQVWQEKLRLASNWWFVTLLISGYAVTWLFAWSIFGSIAFSILIVKIGLLRPPAWLVPPRDVSYGVYLYHFPIMQTLVFFPAMKNPALLLLVVLPLVFGFGYLSSRFVEVPFGGWIGKGKNPFARVAKAN